MSVLLRQCCIGDLVWTQSQNGLLFLPPPNETAGPAADRALGSCGSPLGKEGLPVGWFPKERTGMGRGTGALASGTGPLGAAGFTLSPPPNGVMGGSGCQTLPSHYSNERFLLPWREEPLSRREKTAPSSPALPDTADKEVFVIRGHKSRNKARKK